MPAHLDFSLDLPNLTMFSVFISSTLKFTAASGSLTRMEDVFGFDDGLFPEEDKATRSDEVQFVAHYADSGWFLCSLSNKVGSSSKELSKKCESGNQVSLLKFKGDYLYLRKDFKTAISHYQQMLKLLPPSNIGTRRECCENLARCCSKTGDHCAALHYGNLLHQSSKTVEQLTVSLSCLADICICSGIMEQGALSCMQLITIHKLNSHVWLKFAYKLACLFKVDLSGVLKIMKINRGTDCHSCCCDRKDCLAKEKNDLSHVLKVPNEKVLVLFCVMMTRYILSGVQGTAVGFAAETITTQLSHLDEDIEVLASELAEHKQQLDYIVTKFVFGYNKDLKIDCSEGKDFEDRGSSKFVPSEEIEVSFSTVVGVTWEKFSEKWFKDVFNLEETKSFV